MIITNEYLHKLEELVATSIASELKKSQYATTTSHFGQEETLIPICDLNIGAKEQEFIIYDDYTENDYLEIEKKFKHDYSITGEIDKDSKYLQELIKSDINHIEKGFKLTCLECGHELSIDTKYSESSTNQQNTSNILIETGYGGEVYLTCTNEDCRQTITF